jgi:excisionase family DNA binding protein
MNEASDRRLMTVPEVAQLLNVNEHRTYGLVRDGVIPGAVRIGRRLRIRSDSLHAFIDRGGCAGPVAL